MVDGSLPVSFAASIRPTFMVVGPFLVVSSAKASTPDAPCAPARQRHGRRPKETAAPEGRPVHGGRLVRHGAAALLLPAKVGADRCRMEPPAAHCKPRIIYCMLV